MTNFFNLFKAKEKTVIIRTDGGICSQIFFCALGKHFEDLGYTVKYDTTWFDEWGETHDGVNTRNYDMAKAFPGLKLQTASKKEILYYKIFHRSFNLNKLKRKMYINGYPVEREKTFLKYIDYFKKHFDPVDKDVIVDLASKIENNNSCAIHVRRGDLSSYNIYYGAPAPVSYFLKAINLINSLHKDVKFFFFSEEPQWIKENILPELASDVAYEVIEKNDCSKGYLDLYLISKCKHVIASNGSFGPFGKALSDVNTTLVLSKHQNLYCKLENVYIINYPETLPGDSESLYPKHRVYKKVIILSAGAIMLLAASLFAALYFFISKTQ